MNTLYLPNKLVWIVEPFVAMVLKIIGRVVWIIVRVPDLVINNNSNYDQIDIKTAINWLVVVVKKLSSS